MNASTMDDIAARYPEAFRPSLTKRYSVPLALLACLAYSGYCWWFFSVGTVLEKANWGLAGNYLADWVSYEIRPDIELHDGYVTIKYSKFSELGPNPNPDWVVKEQAAPAAGAEAPITRSIVSLRGAELVIEPDLVTVTRGSETIHLDIRRGEQVVPREPLPAWLEQRRPGSTVYASFGFAGRAEIQNDEVVVWRRFLGWANFVFDTNSPFWGKSTGEVISTIVSGPRIDPAQSNLSLAFDNILNNAEWQHGDVWLKLGQTIVMAFVGTLLASIVAFPLAFLAARNITRSWLTNQVLKRSFDFLRSVDMLIWALFFTRGFGPGPISGMAAIFVTDTGTFGKLYSEALENIDDKQREGIKSVGAAPVLVQRYGVLPQVLPVFASQSLYFWESNTRSATIIGAVGAGGIGLKLWEAMRTNSDWENVAYMVLLILAVVFIFDALSNALRKRLMGEKVGR
jgi:phosphonate transport system permease protein